MNFGLVIVLVIFLLFAFGAGASIGKWYCSTSEEEATSAMTSSAVYLLLAGLFGYWSYYAYCEDQRRKYNKNILFVMSSEEQDPNMASAEAKREEEQVSAPSESDDMELDSDTESEKTELAKPLDLSF